MAWTRFMDMHSGGGCKLGFEHIYIEASKEEAYRVFYAKFKRDPDYVTCNCCGQDFSVNESETLVQATGFDRGCDYDAEEGGYVDRPSPRSYGNKYVEIEEYVLNPTIKVIFANEITDEERNTRISRTRYTCEDYDW